MDLPSRPRGERHLMQNVVFEGLMSSGAALAVVKATSAAVSQDNPWNGGTLKWIGILLLLLLGCGLASYYCHVYLEDDGTDEAPAANPVGRLLPGHSTTFCPVRQERYTASTSSNA